MKGPIDRPIQRITQIYRGEKHRGIDLRSVDMDNGYKLQSVQATEAGTIARVGVDSLGNDYVVLKPHDTKIADEIKYIHIHHRIQEGDELEEGAYIGVTAIRSEYHPPRSNSEAHHLHFETWKDGKSFDPVQYFKARKIDYAPK